MLVNGSTGDGYDPMDVFDFPDEVGGRQSCAHFVARFGRRLTGAELEEVRIFLSQWRGGPQL
jgi:hypothetical protein